MNYMSLTIETYRNRSEVVKEFHSKREEVLETFNYELKRLCKTVKRLYQFAYYSICMRQIAYIQIQCMVKVRFDVRSQP